MSGFIYGRNPNADTLDGLDSTAFAILAGQAGGQVLNGGTGASETLTLVSTSNATKGGITLTGSHVILPGSIRPAADGTTALTLCKANGDAIVTVDTTNGTLSVAGQTLAKVGHNGVGFRAANTDNANKVFFEIQTDADGDGQLNVFNLNEAQTVLIHANASSYINGGFFGIGTTNPGTRLDIAAGAMTFAEMTAPGAGAANTARVYAVDNGGKTELVVQFATGSPIRLAIEV